jgi:branched-chain amino acid aminotransferase
VNSALAKSDAVKKGFDEAIFLNPDGHVAEGSAMNLFMVREGELITPPVNANILEGVTRRGIIELARRELGLEVVERSVDRTELHVADEVFFCGTGAQVAPVVEIDHRAVGDGGVGPVTSKLRELYELAVRGELDQYLHWLLPVYNDRKIELPAMPALDT